MIITDYYQTLHGNSKQVHTLDDFKVKQSDFIGERKGKFRDFYSFGPQLGTGKLQWDNQFLKGASERSGNARIGKLGP